MNDAISNPIRTPFIDTKIVDEEIQVTAILSGAPQSFGFGARQIFLGVVRDFNQGKKVVGVSYDALVPLAIQVFAEIASEAAAKWTRDARIVIVHRRGRLNVGEASLFILVETPHRAEAYGISRYVLEEIKKRAPIWKQEHYETGDSRWLQGHALCGHPEENAGPKDKNSEHHRDW